MERMTLSGRFSRDVLEIDAAEYLRVIQERLRGQVVQQLRRRGVVVGLSGGIDSSVTASLCVQALGKDRVFGLMMPEQSSSPESLRLATELADSLGIESRVEDVEPILEVAGCYERSNRAICEVVPEYCEGCRWKISISSVLEHEGFRYFNLIVELRNGERRELRLNPAIHLELLAAMNMKQRTRKLLEYYHADRLKYAVAGTPNRLEYDQGFFVKNGDGTADVKPIAHLYKVQVYQLGEYLGIHPEILARVPTTEIFSLSQSQEEFYFSLPFDQMDLCHYASDNHVSVADAAAALDLSEEQVSRVYREIDHKRQTARYLHASALLIDDTRPV